MNFDGWLDVRIAQSLPSSPNVPYVAWLFDPASGTFVLNRDLMKVTEPWFDARTRHVTSTVRHSCCSWSDEVYEWQKGRLQLTEKIDTDVDENIENCRTVRRFKLADGKMKLVKREKICDKK